MTRQPEPAAARATSPGASLQQWLEQTQGIARAELEQLLMARLGLSRAKLILASEQPLSADQMLQLASDIQRLRDHEPLAYVLGEQPFHDIHLAVDARVLAPRPETELLVATVLEYVRAQTHGKVQRIADLGTGSGAIAIALANALADVSDIRISACDRSQAALELAAANALAAKTNVQFVHSDWLDALPGPFDLIVSNPPYIAAADQHLPQLRHEPIEALVAGPDGLSDLRQIITGAPACLRANGTLFVEHGMAQGYAVRELFDLAGFIAVQTLRDYSQHERMTWGVLEQHA